MLTGGAGIVERFAGACRAAGTLASAAAGVTKAAAVVASW